MAAINQQASIMAGYFQHGHVGAPSAIIDRTSGKLSSYPQLVEARAAALDAGDETRAKTIETRITAYKNWVNLGQIEGGGAAPDPSAKQLSHNVGIEVNNMRTAVEGVLNP